MAVEDDVAVVGRQEPGDDVEARRLAGAVGAEKADDLASLDGEGDAADDRSLLETLTQVAGDEALVAGDQFRNRAAVATTKRT